MYTPKISDLQNEWTQSKLLSARISTNYDRNLSDNSPIPSLFVSDNKESSQSEIFSDQRLSVPQYNCQIDSTCN